ncbi:hypothetical protein JIN85_08460 [Luteolibacter pohnpeiensis]|uniref:Uncharacterized protein n=1 Tax=Luteolibacter pohnpeiensis TaxID=454153 RepID=A0A934SAQ4_9BACT|nr:DUF6600 domain-containing protein [Luteolibacter pohnpeiensis]MBK1882444.1 hypothetical protein [Luteolibacter pohnpeiensis]
MKNYLFASVTAASLLATVGCDRNSDTSRRISELEAKAEGAIQRQQQLEQELANQKLAAEREAIERERMQLEEDRIAMAQKQGEADAAAAAELDKREQALNDREGRLDNKEIDLTQKQVDLSDRELELAGRDPFPDNEYTTINTNIQQVPVADYNTFYEPLASYGSWFQTADYGYVYQPVAVRTSGWRPYTRGRWVCTDYGWNWVSDEPFGWACYHYGRWVLLRNHGWVWVPGSEWAPAWVTWRQSGSHIGWAPLPPETLAWSNRGWDSSVEVTFGISAGCFNFVLIQNFGGPIFRNCLPVSRNIYCMRESHNITHISFHNHRIINGGPRYDQLSRDIGHRLPFYRMRMDRDRQPGRDSLSMRPRFSGDQIAISAPTIDARWNDALRPSKVRGKLDNIEVERSRPLSSEITNRFRESRAQEQRQATEAVKQMGGKEAFQRQRIEQLEQNRKVAMERQASASPQRPDRNDPQVATRPQRPESGGGISDRGNPNAQPNRAVENSRQTSRGKEQQALREKQSQQAQRERTAQNQGAEQQRQQQEQRIQRLQTQQRQQQEQQRQREEAQQQQVEQQRQQQKQQRQREDAQQRQVEQQRQQQEQQRQREDAQQRQVEQQRQQQEQQRQREEAQQRQVEQQRQQQEQQRQREEAQQRQVEQQRQQQEQQRQREEARQRQVEQQRQQQEQQRQREEARQRQVEQQRQQQEQQRQREEAQQRQVEQQRQQQEQQRQREEARQRQVEQQRQQQEQQRQREEAQQRQVEQQRQQQEQQRQREEARQRQVEQQRQQQEQQRQREVQQQRQQQEQQRQREVQQQRQQQEPQRGRGRSR